MQDPSSALKAVVGTATSTSANAKEEDDDDIDGKYVATEMQRINDPRAKQWLKFKLQGLLFEAQYGGGSNYCTSLSVQPGAVHIHVPALAILVPDFLH